MAASLASRTMDSSTLPKPTRKATSPAQPLSQPAHFQQPFPYSNQYYYPNYPQQYQQQGYFAQAPDQQQQQQFAQWAFQQMMFNSQQQQQQMSAMPGVPDFSRQRTGSGAGQEYGGYPPMLPPHLGFQPSGTPPPHAHPQASGHAIPATGHAMHQMQYNSVGRTAGADHQGFHPYRRPGAGAGPLPQQQRSASAGAAEFGHFQGPYPPNAYPQGYPQPSRPYAREMNGSNTSLHSNGSGSGRQRTGSNAGRQNGTGGGGNGSVGQRSPAHAHGRNQSTGSSITATSARASDRSVTPPARNATASPVSISPGPSPTTGTAPPLPNGRTSSGSANSGSGSTSTMRPAKPSPLSQQTFSGIDPSKRLSRDDSTLEAPNAGLPKNNGLKGRLRRALSFSAVSTLDEGEEGKEKLGSRRKAIEKANKANAALQRQQNPDSVDSPGAAESVRTTTSKKPSRSASLFNRKFNSSTDNISLQSTVSSASVMIRKLGSMGNLARRNSLAGLTGLFKDKKNKERGHKSDASEASVTHATVELDRPGPAGVDDIPGLSPAAKLARQHTLRTNAQAAERARAEAQQAATAAQAPQFSRVEEEDEDEESDDGTYEHPTQMTGGFDDEEVTVRLERTRLTDGPSHSLDDDEIWAVGIRRSVERTRQPAKGILRNAINFDQEKYLDKENAPSLRQRANSETNPSSQTGPPSHVPPPDPHHIDGLSRSSSPHETVISTFAAEFSDFTTPSLSLSDRDSKISSSGDRESPFNYTHPALNSSAPVLSSIGNTPVTQRSATAPGRSRKVVFATNLSVYDTFAPSTYDRRSEPATCNRLTPALAQRIKEEMNSYRMEEMVVHPTSRKYTHFFV